MYLLYCFPGDASRTVAMVELRPASVRDVNTPDSATEIKRENKEDNHFSNGTIDLEGNAVGDVATENGSSSIPASALHFVDNNGEFRTLGNGHVVKEEDMAMDIDGEDINVALPSQHPFHPNQALVDSAVSGDCSSDSTETLMAVEELASSPEAEAFSQGTVSRDVFANTTF